MIQLLVVGSVILAQGPFAVTEECVVAPDIVFPKHVLDPAWMIVNAAPPADFTCSTYVWEGGQLARKPPPAAPVPPRVPMLNAHLVLIEAGLMGEVTAYVEAMPEADRALARAYMDKAQTVARDHPLVLSLASALGASAAEVDQFFIRAEALNV